MNSSRRNEIERSKLNLEKLIDGLKKVLKEEEYAYDNMPEGLKGTLNGMNSEDAISCLEKAIDDLENAFDNLDEIY